MSGQYEPKARGVEASQDGRRDDTPLSRAWHRVKDEAHLLHSTVTVMALCESAVAWLGVAGASVLVSTGPGSQEVRVATDDLATVLAELEVMVGEGPVRSARELRSPVLVGDFDAAEQSRRWPLYAPLAVQTGVHAQFVLPLRVGLSTWARSYTTERLRYRWSLFCWPTHWPTLN